MAWAAAAWAAAATAEGGVAAAAVGGVMLGVGSAVSEVAPKAEGMAALKEVPREARWAGAAAAATAA